MKRSQRQISDSLLDVNIIFMRGVGITHDPMEEQKENNSESHSYVNNDSDDGNDYDSLGSGVGNVGDNSIIDCESSREPNQSNEIDQTINSNNSDSEIDLSNILERELIFMGSRRVKRFRSFLEDSLIHSAYATTNKEENSENRDEQTSEELFNQDNTSNDRTDDVTEIKDMKMNITSISHSKNNRYRYNSTYYDNSRSFASFLDRMQKNIKTTTTKNTSPSPSSSSSLSQSQSQIQLQVQSRLESTENAYSSTHLEVQAANLSKSYEDNDININSISKNSINIRSISSTTMNNNVASRNTSINSSTSISQDKDQSVIKRAIIYEVEKLEAAVWNNTEIYWSDLFNNNSNENKENGDTSYFTVNDHRDESLPNSLMIPTENIGDNTNKANKRKNKTKAKAKSKAHDKNTILLCGDEVSIIKSLGRGSFGHVILLASTTNSTSSVINNTTITTNITSSTNLPRNKGKIRTRISNHHRTSTSSSGKSHNSRNGSNGSSDSSGSSGSSSSSSEYALKVDRGCAHLLWECVIHSRLRQRSSNNDNRSGSSSSSSSSSSNDRDYNRWKNHFLYPNGVCLYKNAVVCSMRAAELGSLLDVIRLIHVRSTLFSQKEREVIAAYMAYQMLISLDVLHKANILHCDQKPDNWLLTIDAANPNPNPTSVNTELEYDNVHLRLIDFGKSKDILALRRQNIELDSNNCCNDDSGNNGSSSGDSNFNQSSNSDVQIPNEVVLFTGVSGVKGMVAPEILKGSTWAYYADYYGACACIHSLLFLQELTTCLETKEKAGSRGFSSLKYTSNYNSNSLSTSSLTSTTMNEIEDHRIRVPCLSIPRYFNRQLWSCFYYVLLNKGQCAGTSMNNGNPLDLETDLIHLFQSFLVNNGMKSNENTTTTTDKRNEKKSRNSVSNCQTTLFKALAKLKRGLA